MFQVFWVGFQTYELPVEFPNDLIFSILGIYIMYIHYIYKYIYTFI